MFPAQYCFYLIFPLSVKVTLVNVNYGYLHAGIILRNLLENTQKYFYEGTHYTVRLTVVLHYNSQKDIDSWLEQKNSYHRSSY